MKISARLRKETIISALLTAKSLQIVGYESQLCKLFSPFRRKSLTMFADVLNEGQRIFLMFLIMM